jgi:hypothetical protein
MQHANFNGKIETQEANPAMMGPELRAKHGSDFKYVVQASWVSNNLLTIGDRHYTKKGIFFEPDAPEMLTLNMIRGTRAGLKDPYSILLSASAAQALFGNADPINKVIKLDRTFDVKVTGVYEDLPDNTTFHDIQIMMPWELWMIQNPWAKTMTEPWGSNFSQTYVQIGDNADMEKLSAKIKNVKLDNLSGEEKKYHSVCLAVWHYRHFCVGTGLHQFYEPCHGTQRKESERSGHPQNGWFVTVAIGKTVFCGVVPGCVAGVCTITFADCVVVAIVQ